jgi:hypothetical protein
VLEGPVPRAAVVVADGLFDISYGPTVVVLLDGNVPAHGITNLRELPSGGSAGGAARKELERFSVIVFSDFQRNEGMMKHGNYSGMWCDSMLSSVLWK